VLRKFLAQEAGRAQSLDVYALSAKFGLIPATRTIPYYDQRMTTERIHTLRPRVVKQMGQVLKTKIYSELFLSLGSDYLQAIDGYEPLIPPEVELTISNGTPGRKLTNLRDWLYRDTAPTIKPPVLCTHKTVSIRGIPIKATPAQVLAIARCALVKGYSGFDSYQSWYVLVDSQRIAPKWLVSQLSGLPVSDFHTGEATRVLQQLCIEVKRL
jgi:hypothetical protein